MIVGSIVLATDQGLGYLAKSFYDNDIIQKVMIRQHTSRQNHRDWYREADVVRSIDDLLEQCDALIFFEEVWEWNIIPLARSAGIKTVLMPMYECTRNPLPYQPDMIIAPSLLDQRYFPGSTFIPVPVDTPWKLRKRARHFVHNAGNGGLGGRNGTKELLEAMQHVKSPIQLTIRSQVPLHLDLGRPHDNAAGRGLDDKRVEVIVKNVPKDKLWQEGDVMIFPEKFNGLSLPLQEAHAAGLLVMAGNRFPMNTWLPQGPLIPVSGYKKERITVEFDAAIYTPEAIAATIDSWYDRDISMFSRIGKKWGEAHSWQTLKEKYKEVLSPLLAARASLGRIS